MKDEIRDIIEQIRHGNVPAGYKKTKAGILPADWYVHILGDCLSRVENPVEVKPNELYTQIGIRSHGKGLFYKEPVTGAALGNKSVFWIEPDCFIVNIVFAWEQAIGKTTQSEVGMIGSHRFPMYRPVNNRVDVDYLISYFLTKRGTDILEAASPGGAGRNKTLGQDRFLKSKIILPPIEEQRKIAAILTTQDKVIELKEKRLAEKQRQKKYLMQQLLTGKKRLPGFSGEWKKRCIEDTCDCLDKLRRPINASDREKIKGEYPYYGANGVVDYISDYIFNDNLILLAEDGGNFDDFSNSSIATWVCGKVWVNNHAHVLRPRNIFCAKYIFYALEHLDIRKFINGTTRSKLTQADMQQIAFEIPINIEEQIAIAEVLSAADREIDLLRQDIEQEKQKKKALMQLLLTGMVRVQNILKGVKNNDVRSKT